MSIRSAFRHFTESLFGRTIEGTRIVPIVTKITLLFTVLLLASNLTTNYINLISNREELVKSLKELLIKDLRELYTFANHQHSIFQFNKDRAGAIGAVTEKASNDLKMHYSLAEGVLADGSFLFRVSAFPGAAAFGDQAALATMLSNKTAGILEGFLPIRQDGREYFAVYKHNPKWDAFLVRAEDSDEFYERSNRIFLQMALVSLLITLGCALLGILLLRRILRFLGVITDSMLRMRSDQQLSEIDLAGAPNDDVTFLGVSFNSLSSSINNLLKIFRKFVNRDVVTQAYREHEVRLEGSKRELTCLFSDIRQFTFMTETLGTEIITLLNLHYDRAIREILHHDGIIGSIIGDALLAVFGAIDESRVNKSWQSLKSAYAIQEVAESLRQRMSELRERIEKKMGRFTPEEERVFKAVLIEVGVGIDGGQVFYGNIGSVERMTNTVIGDTVNSASRLEGLTRIYHVPVICSEFIKLDIEKNIQGHGCLFIELDTVQVKGKTIGKKVFWPVSASQITRGLRPAAETYEKALAKYYAGQWSAAEKLFSACSLPPAAVFRARIQGRQCPKNWNGIWTMETK